ncbi:MAG: lactonase family protein [Saprospirales bacterium]|jgi:6-phosphogluconolactonase|nr:lactonase family protein [Saprospirales bacterium]
MKYSALLFLALLAACSCSQPATPDNAPLVFVGTYTGDLGFVQGKAEGIYTCRLDTATGALTVVDTARGIRNPSFLTLSADKKKLYAVAENGGKPGEPYGSVVAYRISPSGRLEKINEQPSYGAAPCHIALDAGGQVALVANYATGNVASYRINPDGSLSDSLCRVQHPGKSPWAHMILPMPGRTGRVVAVDKGADQLFVYALENGKLRRLDSLRLPAGAGPRHLDFHPSDPTLAVVICENNSTLVSVRFDAQGLHPQALYTQTTLPPDFQGKNTCADVHIHPGGQLVYGSNRGHNSIAVFGLDAASGRLQPLGHTPTQGETPRNFLITPKGNLLLVANQNTGNVATFRINTKTGQLLPTGLVRAIPTPVCLKM